jgi:hypothetical protein
MLSKIEPEGHLRSGEIFTYQHSGHKSLSQAQQLIKWVKRAPPGTASSS